MAHVMEQFGTEFECFELTVTGNGLPVTVIETGLLVEAAAITLIRPGTQFIPVDPRLAVVYLDDSGRSVPLPVPLGKRLLISADTEDPDHVLVFGPRRNCRPDKAVNARAEADRAREEQAPSGREGDPRPGAF